MNRVVAIKQTKALDATALAVALQEQAVQLDRFWGTGPVTVVSYRCRKPKGAWRIQFYNTLPAGEGGIHLNTKNGTPYAKILASEGSVAASHEFCEMLVDPLGQRFHQVGDRNYLVEVCDPVETLTYNASNGVLLSDFITPAWYNTIGTGTGDYLTQDPSEKLMPGGYASYILGLDWWQVYADQDGRISDADLGRAVLKNRREKDGLATRYARYVLGGSKRVGRAIYQPGVDC